MTSAPVVIGLDIETTGLESDCDILELGMIAFDADRSPVAEFSVTIAARPVEELQDRCIPYVRQMHDSNGLWDDLSVADTRSYAEAEALAVSWLTEVTRGEKLPMFGNSITFDRNAVANHMPDLYEMFHYRSVDATSIYLAASLFYGVDVAHVESGHRVLSDLRDGMALLTRTFDGLLDTLGPVWAATQPGGGVDMPSLYVALHRTDIPDPLSDDQLEYLFTIPEETMTAILTGNTGSPAADQIASALIARGNSFIERVVGDGEDGNS